MGHSNNPLLLKQLGRFADALRALEAASASTRGSTPNEVLYAELLERVGRYADAKRVAENLLKSRRLTPSERSACHLVVGRVDSTNGDVGASLANFQRAVTFAETAQDPERSFWAQLRLFVTLSEQSGPDAASAMLTTLRATAAKTGDASVLAALHLFVAQAEAKRGLVRPTVRHLALARPLVQMTDNQWLQATSEHLETAVATLRGDLSSALDHARLALGFAESTGAKFGIATAHGNIANIFLLTGDYTAAVDHQEIALRMLPRGSDNYVAALDLLAQTAIAECRFEDADAFLDQVGAIETSSNQLLTYAHRHVSLTRVELLRRRCAFGEALRHATAAIRAARSAGDILLQHLVTFARAELCVQTHNIEEAISALRSIAVTTPQQQPTIYARYQAVVGLICQEAMLPRAAVYHFERAKRFYLALGDVQGRSSIRETVRYEDVANQTASFSDGLADVFESVSSVLAFPGRTDVVAGELAALLERMGIFDSVSVIQTPVRAQGSIEPDTSNRHTSDDPDEHRILVGVSRQNSVELRIRSKTGPSSFAVLQALNILVAALRELDNAQAVRDDRLSIWPPDPDSTNFGRWTVSGHMLGTINIARRIAKTNVTVLITGESGTGKEIIARAIHEASDNADKPFIPFNCTTVPRDLLESQLFGHRRGAFTGADRDYAGLIRSARDGTLFLDEVGELGLDLQPKLLRFLESGEIAPLGEPGPTQVKVRIVAATNTNLEELVRAGKFREDLFYRLNVVRLNVKPLRERRDEIPGFIAAFVARAADEFKKGTLTVSEETMDRLLLYRWPGNVRQLQNEIRRIVALAEPNSTLAPEMISSDILDALPIFRRPGVNDRELSVSLQSKLLPTLAQVECEMIQAALKQSGGKVSAAAKALGISRKGLYLKRQRFRL